MELVVSRDELLKGLGHIQGIVEKRNTIPMLANVLLRTESAGLFMIATDLEIEAKEKIVAAITKEGAVTVPAHTLYEIVRKLPSGADIHMIKEKDERLAVSSGKSKFKLGCLPVEEFPVMQGEDLSRTLKIPAADFKLLLDRTKFAMSTEETRYYLNGIYLHAVKVQKTELLRAVATDGHRLAKIEIPAPKGASGMAGIILPRKTVGEVRKMLEEWSDDIEIAASENKIRFSFGDIVITSKLVDGTFPDYERVIPSNNDKDLEVDTKDFAAAVDRVATIVSEKSRAIKISVSAGKAVLSASSQEAGSAVEELDVKYEHEAMEVGFNSRYILDILQQIQGEKTKFVLANASAPAIIMDSNDTAAVYVLMPMRV
ncbi:MAG: DNA polymerase III subunit beta [Alphaproteobacteria bacterium]|nr:DNA polymerase III subunit beta [Alphaproteobacteria bacterium]